MKSETVAREGRPTGLRPSLVLSEGESVSPEFYADVSKVIITDFLCDTPEPHLAKDGLSTAEVRNSLENTDPLEEDKLPGVILSFAGQTGKLDDAVNNFRSDEELKSHFEIKTHHTYNISVSVEAQSEIQAIRIGDYLFRALLDYSAVAFQHVQASKVRIKPPELPKSVSKSKKHFAVIIVIMYDVDLETRIRSQETPVNTVEIR